ncbi:hypothetical protein Pcinc_015450 [Petrolisthes cinctipes]|uniref:Uncharacterized protein n=1 Tax=Petrolisthes cinctipes TaxID=88211 RepID=A0AAE1FUU8_PETCI|nr:hypothetical protein Pcinc_015450 [Petrolisthes cinctipes]
MYLRRRWASRRSMSDSWQEERGSAATTETYLPQQTLWSREEGTGSEVNSPSGAGSPHHIGSPVVWELSGGSGGAWCGCAGVGQPSCSSPLHESLVGGLTERFCCLLEPWRVDVGIQTGPHDEERPSTVKPRKFSERHRSGYNSERDSIEKSFDRGNDTPGATWSGKGTTIPLTETATGAPPESYLSTRRRSSIEVQRPRSSSCCAEVDTTKAGKPFPGKFMCGPTAMEFASQTSPGSLGGSPPPGDAPCDSESFDQDELTSHLQELPSHMPRRASRTGIFNGLYTSINQATKLRLVHQLSVDETRSTVYADLAALAATPDLTGAPPLPYTADLTPLKPSEKRRRFFQRKQTNSAPDSFDGNLPLNRGPHSVSYCLDSALKVPTLLPWQSSGKKTQCEIKKMEGLQRKLETENYTNTIVEKSEPRNEVWTDE